MKKWPLFICQNISYLIFAQHQIKVFYSLSVIFRQWWRLVLAVFCGFRTRLIETETWKCDCRFLIYTSRWRLCSLLLGHLVLPPVTCHIIPWLYGCEHQSRGNLSKPPLKREREKIILKKVKQIFVISLVQIREKGVYSSSTSEFVF